jgi:ATP-dependent Lon protease
MNSTLKDKIKNYIDDKSNNDMINVIEKKIAMFNDMIQNTILNAQYNKTIGILEINDVNNCISKLNLLNDKIKQLYLNNQQNTVEIIINNLQDINNELSSIFKLYGTKKLEDLVSVCFGTLKFNNNEDENNKYDLLKKYFHPTCYKVINFNENIVNLECIDIEPNHKKFYYSIYGLKLYITDVISKQSIIIYGIIDNIIIHLLDNKYLNDKNKNIKNFLPSDLIFQGNVFLNYLTSLNLKDFLINDYNNIYCKFAGYLSQYNLFKHKNTSQFIKEFVSTNLFTKRNILIQLLINSDNYENMYMAYLLYDLLSNDVNGTIDTQEQILIFDSFTWPIKEFFKDAMKKTIQYTNSLSNFDINKIPLEQQICLMKTTDNVKEKAMIKLKEIKTKSDDSGSKAKQYLDGLLKIPFNVFKKEPILNIINENKSLFYKLLNNYSLLNIPQKEIYSSIEIKNYINVINSNIKILQKNEIINHFSNGNKETLIKNIISINNYNINKINYYNKNKTILKNEIINTIEYLYTDLKYNSIIEEFYNIINKTKSNTERKEINDIIDEIENNFTKTHEYMNNVKNVLDESIYGHEKAKEQIEKIIAQWINGEQDGYCFGFEGPPGVGKTSLAKKGISNCLKDENNVCRPFSFIQIGGDSNGSTLQGHNYTYVGSTWGIITQILIDKKCMNPIIFIDEVDKISKTENGKEIIGILTHLLDPTQNDVFQDKYFNGIDLDLSKALFILSYNDVNLIDKILLDRIHRIRFDILSIEEKIIISKKHIIPEICKKMGFNSNVNNIINFENSTIRFIIENYTHEAGVRKLKEKLFEIIGQINIDLLKGKISNIVLPINITIEDVKNKYFKDKHEFIIKQVHNKSSVGIVNGMWASSAGQGGTLQINAMFFPSGRFMELKLTGLQEKVMQESMHVSQTLAWNLTPQNKQNEIRDMYDDKHKYGIHIHVGDGSISKDGPSGGVAITVVIYSILNNKLIKNNVALTGEIDLNGSVNQIGGLDLKMMGSIKSGVNEFIFPKENNKDFNNFIEKYKDNEMINGVKFHPVSNIQEVFELIYEE